MNVSKLNIIAFLFDPQCRSELRAGIGIGVPGTDLRFALALWLFCLDGDCASHTDTGADAAEFLVNMSEHPIVPNQLSVHASLLDVATDDDGNISETPNIDYALIE